MENMNQWVPDYKRFSGQDAPSQLDLIFTKEVNVIENIEYYLPLGKSDHMMIQFEIKKEGGEVRNENHKIGTYNFVKANHVELGRYFENADWSRFEANGVEKNGTCYWKFTMKG